MANNIITAAFSSSTITYTKPAYQYDYGMILKFSGIELPQAYEVHFSNTEFCGESISQIGDETGVTIPDEMFLSGAPIYAWTYLHTGEDDGETVYKTVISINKRAQPSDIEPTPVQQDVITQAIAALNTAVEQTAADVVAAGESAEAAAGSAEAAGQAKDDAVEAKDKAVEAKNAAETAQGKAEDAQRAAEQAAGSVLGLTADATVDANVGTPSVSVSVTTESDHKKMSFAFHNLKGVQGDTGVGISSVVLNADYTLTITLTNGTSYTTTSIRGEVGATPNLTIGTISTLPEGSQATATITGTDEDPVLNLGIPVGNTGVGIASVEKTGTSGLVDTYTITYTDGTTSTFEVTNGQDGEVSEEQLETALIDKADIITSSSSGEIVTVQDGMKDAPVLDLSVSLLPVQDLHGQDAPYPPGGGKNLWDTTPYSGLSYNISVGTTVSLTEYGSVTVSGNTISYSVGSWGYRDFKTKPLTAGTYHIHVDPSATTNPRLTLYVVGSDNIIKSATPSSDFLNENRTVADGDYIVVYVGTNTAQTLTIKDWQIESGSSYTGFAPYSNICPISGWTGVEVYHSDADTSNPTTYPISWQSSAGTVYGGSLDLTTGVLTVDRAKVVFDGTQTDMAFASGTTSNRLSWAGYISIGKPYSGFISDTLKPSSASPDIASDPWLIYTGASGTVRMFITVPTSIASVADWNTYCTSNPISVFYELATPTTYQLTPVQIQTLLGTNNFWSNGNGTLDLEYRADTKLYIEQLTKPSEDDMVANANIVSGKFFMVGNRLFLSTTAIAQGEQIVVGTNCSEVSLADALNQINA